MWIALCSLTAEAVAVLPTGLFSTKRGTTQTRSFNVFCFNTVIPPSSLILRPSHLTDFLLHVSYSEKKKMWICV